MEIINTCPVCSSDTFETYLICTDHTVSKKEFTIVKCKSCGFKYTNPRPSEIELGGYYKSDEYISHSDIQKGLVNRLYHFVRKYTLIKKLQLVARLTAAVMDNNSKNILDIGCGTGAFLDVCNKAGFNCLGIEPDPDARKIALNKYGVKVMGEEELMNLPNETFDLITLWHVLEHVPRLNERIEKIKVLLKPMGRVIVAVPNCSSYDAKYYKHFWAAYDVPRHLYHFTPEDISRLFVKNGMKVEQCLPMRFDSFYVSMLSEKYKTGKSNFIKAIWIGFKSNFLAIRSGGKQFSSQIYVISKS